MGRLQAQAAGKEAELTSKLEEYAATVAEKEREVLDLQAALDMRMTGTADRRKAIANGRRE